MNDVFLCDVVILLVGGVLFCTGMYDLVFGRVVGGTECEAGLDQITGNNLLLIHCGEKLNGFNHETEEESHTDEDGAETSVLM